jgi:hypothetical protein
LYSFTTRISLIKRIILTILPAFAPTLDALPVFASLAALSVYEESPLPSPPLNRANKGFCSHATSKMIDSVEITSRQKKNEQK